MSTTPPSPNSPTSPTSPSKDSTHEKRVALACHRCRAKRARCSGHKPSCQACEKANEECTWPVGRRRKRTRREMEEDERREREAAANAGHLRTFLAPEIHPHSSMSWVSGHPRLDISDHSGNRFSHSRSLCLLWSFMAKGYGISQCHHSRLGDL
jgi:Fungal Zn(2)-Cys(6) binuclear cluster domain